MKSKFKQFWEVFNKGEKAPKLFYMIRNNDESGVSGTGKVLEGVIFSSGKVAVCWDGDTNVHSVAVYDTFEEFKKVHIDAHPDNKTEIKYLYE